jgi:hypothetical protein
MPESSGDYTQRMGTLAAQTARQCTGLVAQRFYYFLYPSSSLRRNIRSFINYTRNRLCGYPRHRRYFLNGSTHSFWTHIVMLSFPLPITGTITFYCHFWKSQGFALSGLRNSRLGLSTYFVFPNNCVGDFEY